MARDDYLDRIETKTSICGGAVLDLFRNKNKNKEKLSSRGSTTVRTLERRTGSNSDSTPSVSSLDQSVDEPRIGAKTALLRGYSQSPGGGSKFFVYNKTSNSIEEIVPNRFRVDHNSISKHGGIETNTSLQSSSSSGAKNKSQGNKAVRPETRSVSSKDSGQSAQPKRRTVRVIQVTQAEIIQKLQMEKKSYAAETLLLREEMQQIRQQLDAFQRMLLLGAHQKQEPLPRVPSFESTGASHNRSTVSASLSQLGNEFGFSEWEIPKDENHDEMPVEGNHEEAPDEKGRHDSMMNEDISRNVLEETENYWMQALQHGPPESADSAEEEQSANSYDEDSHKPPRDEGAPSDEDSGVETDSPPAMLGMDRRGAENTRKFDVSELEHDMEFIQRLLAKYHLHLGGSLSREHQPKENTPQQQRGRTMEESKASFDEAGATVHIENLVDVDRSYSQRQIAMERAREAFENGELQEAEFPVVRDTAEHDSTTKRTRNPRKQGATLPPSAKDTIKMNPSAEPRAQRSVRFLEKDNTTSQIRDDQSENRSSIANTEITGLIQNPATESKQPQLGEHSLRSLRSQPSEADEIEMSTSMHNSLYWPSPTSPRTEQRRDELAKPSTVCEDQRSLSSHSSDVMDGIEESVRSRGPSPLFPDVRVVEQIGHGGATYTIPVKNIATDSDQVPPRQESSLQQVPNRPVANPRNTVALPNRPPKSNSPRKISSGSSEPLILLGHAGEYHHIARRLV